MTNGPSPTSPDPRSNGERGPSRLRLYADLLRQTSLQQQLRRLVREADRRLLPGLRARWRPAVDDRSRLYRRLSAVAGFEAATEFARSGRREEALAELGQALEGRAARSWPFDASFWDACFERLPSVQPLLVERVLAEAEHALKRLFDCDGLEPQPLGPIIDWDPQGFGHFERTYALNRLHPLPLLAVAHRLSGDRRFADEIGDLLLQWVRANPRTTGRPWDVLTTALRLNHVLLAWGLLRGTGTLRSEVHEAVLLILRSHADHVAAHLELDLLNNHLIFEARSLLGASCLLPGAAFSARWRRAGLRNLDRELHHQVWPDGTHGEQSSGYHVHMLYEFLAAVRTLRSAGEQVPSGWAERMEGMARHLADLVRPDGHLPMSGDTVRHDPQSPYPEEVLPAAEVLLGLPALHEGGCPGLRGLLLLGPELPVADGRPFRSLSCRSRIQPDGGSCILRDGRKDGLQLILDAGPFAMADNVAHGHADALQIELSAAGRSLLADPGSYTYAPGSWRGHFRGTSAHSTITVDDLDQVHLWGAFRAYRPAGSRLLGHSTGEGLQWADAVHRHSTSGTVHRRRVALLPEGRVLLVDDLELDRLRRACSRLHFAPGTARLRATAGLCSFVEAEGDVGLRVQCEIQPGDDLALVQGREEPPQGWISFEYGVRRPVAVLEWSRAVAGRTRFVCLLSPGDLAEVHVDLSSSGNGISIGRGADERRLELLEIGFA